MKKSKRSNKRITIVDIDHDQILDPSEVMRNDSDSDSDKSDNDWIGGKINQESDSEDEFKGMATVDLADEIEDDDQLDDNIEIEDEDMDYTEYKKDCLYKYAYESDPDEESDDYNYISDDESEMAQGSDNDDNFVKGDDRISKPILTKYERVRLLGDRVAQLVRGAKPLIKNSEGLSQVEIAKLELEKNMMPFYIRRPMPNGSIEEWKLSELAH